MPFHVTEQPYGALIEVTGKFLGTIEGPAFKSTVDAIKGAERPLIVVELSRAEMMDSSGIGVLISALTTMRNTDGDLRLAAVSDHVRKVLTITRLMGTVFEDHPTVEAAANAPVHPSAAAPDLSPVT